MRVTAQAAKIIRKCASEQSMRDGGPRRIRLEAGERCSLTDRSGKTNVNIRMLSTLPDWGDTDLDEFVSWEWFRKMDIEQSANGEVLVDFYVSSVDRYGGELVTNIQAEWKDGILIEVSDGQKAIWRAA